MATSALIEGCDVPSLRRLAGESRIDSADARELFEDVLSEMQLSAPTPRDAVLILARSLANDIVTGRVSPYYGAKEIWRITLSLSEEHFPELDTFVYAASEWEDRPQARNVLAEGIVAAAMELATQ